MNVPRMSNDPGWKKGCDIQLILIFFFFPFFAYNKRKLNKSHSHYNMESTIIIPRRIHFEMIEHIYTHKYINNV